MPWYMRAVVSLIIVGFTAAVLILATFAIAEAWGQGRAIAALVGAWIVMQLFRLGYDYDDGIDVKRLVLPAPFDWGVKVERTIHFWTTRMWFRSVYLGTTIALVVFVICMAARK